MTKYVWTYTATYRTLNRLHNLQSAYHIPFFDILNTKIKRKEVVQSRWQFIAWMRRNLKQNPYPKNGIIHIWYYIEDMFTKNKHISYPNIAKIFQCNHVTMLKAVLALNASPEESVQNTE